MKRTLAALGLCALLGSASAPALAQVYGPPGPPPPPPGVPSYGAWQAAWDRFEYDRHHVIVGEVVGFQPYRIQVMRRNGFVQGIDLKNGTVIVPTGATPTPGERVALVGYYSRGTFIVSQLFIR